MSSDRRDFLHRFALGAAAISTTPSLLSAAPALVNHTPNGVLSDLIATEAEQQQQSITWDVSWAKKITGKHRIVFDMPDYDDGSGVYRAAVWGGHYKQMLDISDEDISTVLVMRHSAVPLIMTHDFWEEYELGKSAKAKHPMTGKKTKRNPVLMDSDTDGLPASFARYSLDKQIEKGTIVLACNLAFNSMVSLVATKHKIRGNEARQQALAGLVPGVIMLPSGIVAVQLAQENGCHYARAT